MSRHANTAQDRQQLERYLTVLAGREPTGGLLELRFRRGPGRPMRQRFYPAERLRRAAETALWLSQTSDVYVGVLPRRRRAGGKAALERAWVLWADCDTSAAAAELERFEPAPAVVVASGVIRSARVQRGCGRAVRCWRHVVSEADWVARGGGRDGR